MGVLSTKSEIIMVYLIVKPDGNKRQEIKVGSRQEAIKLSNTKYKGIKCKVVGDSTKYEGLDMRSYSDMMAGRVA